MPAPVAYFGIRHHGPGSARCLAAALAELQPAAVLIEGPADATDLLPLLGEKDMVPPVALLAYDTSEPANASFWPFAAYSPEYVAVRHALNRGIPVRLIDLPAGITLRARRPEPTAEAPPPTPEEAPANEVDDEADPDETEAASEAVEPTLAERIRRDPIGALAQSAGYEDGESWWSELIEENPEPGPVFAAIAEAMAALRAAVPELPRREAQREAHMRLAITAARKEFDGPVAVVCGAWHVPALTTAVLAKDDREVLKGLPKLKPAFAWAPWTAPRLARDSGYGAGVRYPGWYDHLWHYGDEPTMVTRWLARTAELLRTRGHLVSTASLIEAERLAVALAALRERPAPTFDELRDATVACLCEGETLLYTSIAEALLVGSQVGEIAANTPQAPLLADLQQQQRKAKLKPEALEQELSLDLRSESGLMRSTLLHRLLALNVPWGKLADSGRSRGTFRENWVLRWDPEFAVRLVEQLVHGPTIEQAASNRLVEQLDRLHTVAERATLLRQAMTAQLERAVQVGLDRLADSAAQTADCRDLLEALEPMAEVHRYGQARAGVGELLGDLLRRMALQAFVSLPYAVRDLDAEAAERMASAMQSAQRALQLVELPADDLAGWHEALFKILDQRNSTASLAGLAARLLYEADALSPEEAARHLERRLSPGTVTQEAAGYFEGFLGGIVARMIHDAPLRQAVDQWLQALDEEAFVANLPLFRRVFASLDRQERRRLLESVVRPSDPGTGFYELVAAPTEWDAHCADLLNWLETGAPR